MPGRIRVFALMAALWLPTDSPAQQTAALDLATNGMKQTVRAGTQINLKIINARPNTSYTIETLVRVQDIPPFDLNALRAVRDDPASACAKMAQLQNELVQAKDENAVEIKVDEIRAAAKCPQIPKEGLIAPTQRDLDVAYKLDSGEELVVAISRDKLSDEVPARSWTFVFTTAKRGKWLVSYGFTFIPNKNDEFFSDPVPDSAGKFIITEKGQNGLLFVPSVLFWWLPASQQGKALVFGPVAGLGFDFAKPTVFAGVQLTYNYNITLTAGAVVHARTRLAGQYSVGDTIMENIQPDAFVEDQYGVSAYFGVGFRFGSNPFADSGAKRPASEVPPAEPDAPSAAD